MSTLLSEPPLSVRLPRVRNVPEYASSLGQEAIELCASAGLHLDPWQQAIITDQLGLRPGGTWASFECGLWVPRQNGKGGCIEARKLAGLFLMEERLITYSAHQFKTAQEHFLRMKQLVEGSADLSRQVKRIFDAHGKEGIHLYGTGKNRLTGIRRLLYVARSRSSGRGFTGVTNLLDEAQELTDAEHSALLPTMSAMSMTGNPQILLYGTPPDVTKGEGEYWVPFRERGVRGGTRLCWHEYSPPPGKYDPADRRIWYDTNPALGIRISEEFVQSEYEAMGDGGPSFRRERLGEPPADGDDAGWEVIAKADWARCLDPLSQIEGRLAFAVEVSHDREFASIAAAGLRSDGLRHGELVARQARTDWVTVWLAERLVKWGPVAIVVDPSGPAGSLVPEIQRVCAAVAKEHNTVPVEVMQPTGRDVAAACGSMYDALIAVEQKLRVRPGPLEKELTAAARGAAWRERGDARVWDRRNESAPDAAPFMAMTLADYGFANAPEPPDDYDPLANIF